LLTFEVPAGTTYFTLEVNGHQIHQPLSDQASLPPASAPPPPSVPARAAPPPLPAEFVSTPQVPPAAIPVAIPVGLPVSPAAPVAEKKESKGLQDFDLEDLAKSIDLEFEKPSGDTGIELDKNDGK